jgi:hypothetical protein
MITIIISTPQHSRRLAAQRKGNCGDDRLTVQHLKDGVKITKDS